MTERPKFFDDIAGVAGGALSAFGGLKEETTALIKARVEEVIRKLDLVRREELDVANDLALKAMEKTTELSARIAALEAAVSAISVPSGARIDDSAPSPGTDEP